MQQLPGGVRHSQEYYKLQKLENRFNVLESKVEKLISGMEIGSTQPVSDNKSFPCEHRFAVVGARGVVKCMKCQVEYEVVL